MSRTQCRIDTVGEPRLSSLPSDRPYFPRWSRAIVQRLAEAALRIGSGRMERAQQIKMMVESATESGIAVRQQYQD